ncbi:MAG: hypothetical protein L6R41_001132 [Letrouitia leprolyta]|nr:MAG: hypothetical protein L6R41_001132 [Letrouitia leprolyta]
MPALGSSVINKSGKKFAPKAPVKRPAATNSTQPPARESIERTQPSQASQNEIIQQLAKPTDLAPHAPDLNLGTPALETEPRQEEGDHGGNHLLDYNAAGENTTIQAPDRVLDASPLQSPGRSQLLATAEITIVPSHTSDLSQSRLPTPPSNHVSHSLSHPPSTQNSGEEPLGPPPQSSAGPPVDQPAQELQPETAHEDAPPAKRRKLRSGKARKPSTSRETPSVSNIVPTSSPEATNDTPATTGDLQTDHARVGPTQQALAKKSQSKRKGKQRLAATGADAESNHLGDSTRGGKNNQKTAKVRKSRRATTMSNSQRLQDAAAEIVADAVGGTTVQHKGRRGAKEREATPDEAENETITPGTVKMVDLCKDTRKGRKSDMLKALQERDKEELMRKAQEELQQLIQTGEPQTTREAGDQGVTGQPNGGSGAPTEDVVERQENVIREVADTYVDEHGQIRINTDSLRIDRHAQAAAAREQEQQEAVVENDLSKPATNSRTYAKWGKAKSWPEELTDEFYEALRMFGTDFGMIGRMLRKTRRAIKLKFNREERADPTRINQALSGARIAVDLAEYSRRAGEDIKDTEEHERKMEEDRKKIEEIAADELRAKEEQDKLRREQAEQERAAVPDDSSGKENREVSEVRKKDKKAREKKTSRKKEGKVVAEVP